AVEPRAGSDVGTRDGRHRGHRRARAVAVHDEPVPHRHQRGRWRTAAGAGVRLHRRPRDAERLHHAAGNRHVRRGDGGSDQEGCSGSDAGPGKRQLAAKGAPRTAPATSHSGASMRFARSIVAVVVVCLAASEHAAAQSFQGGLRGAVHDAQGVIPGVTVTLVNQDNGVARDTVTNEVGEYSFPGVVPGTYTVRASVTGFKTFERKDARIGTQQFLTLDILLELGTVEETVTVSAEAP